MPISSAVLISESRDCDVCLDGDFAVCVYGLSVQSIGLNLNNLERRCPGENV